MSNMFIPFSTIHFKYNDILMGHGLCLRSVYHRGYHKKVAVACLYDNGAFENPEVLPEVLIPYNNKFDRQNAEELVSNYVSVAIIMATSSLAKAMRE